MLFCQMAEMFLLFRGPVSKTCVLLLTASFKFILLPVYNPPILTDNMHVFFLLKLGNKKQIFLLHSGAKSMSTFQKIAI